MKRALSVLLVVTACADPPPPPPGPGAAPVAVADGASTDQEARAAAAADALLASLRAPPPAVPPVPAVATPTLAATTPGAVPTPPVVLRASLPDTSKDMAPEMLAALKLAGGDAVDRFWCRGKQSGARGNLKALRVHAETAAAQGKDIVDEVRTTRLRFESKEGQPHYEYVLHQPAGKTFRFDARGIGTMAGDLWHIDESGTVWNETSACGPLEKPNGP